MQHKLFSLNPNPPEGFRHATPYKHDLLSGSVVIFADAVANAVSLLDNFKNRVHGIIITMEGKFFCTQLGPAVWHLGVPDYMLAELNKLSASYIDLMSYGLSAMDEHRQIKIELTNSKQAQGELTKSYNANINRLSGKIEQLRNEMERNRRAEEALQKKELEQRILLDHIRVGILLIDPIDHTIVYCNPMAAEMTYPSFLSL